MKTIKTILFAVTLSISTLAAAGLLSPNLLSAKAQTTVTQRINLTGRYGWHSVVFYDNYSTTTPQTGVGVFNFDGRGGVTGSYVGKYNWQLVSTTFAGTYTVGADGQGAMQFTQENGVTQMYSIVMVNGGQEIYLVHTQPGVNQILTAKKQ